MLQLTKDNFDKTIKESAAPVIVDFWASWCGPCRMMSSILDHFEQNINDGAVIAKVDVDAESELAASYNVSSIPTLIVFRGGTEETRLVGVRPESELKKALGI